MKLTLDLNYLNLTYIPNLQSEIYTYIWTYMKYICPYIKQSKRLRFITSLMGNDEHY